MGLTKSRRGLIRTRGRGRGRSKSKRNRRTYKRHRRGLIRTKSRGRGRSRRGRGADQSVNSNSNNDSDNKWEDKKLALMEEGKPWYTPPSKEGSMVKPNLDAQQSAQRNDDYLGYYTAADQGLTFGGTKYTNRRTGRRRNKRTRRR